jgi:hypothetical protein
VALGDIIELLATRGLNVVEIGSVGVRDWESPDSF